MEDEIQFEATQSPDADRKEDRSTVRENGEMMVRVISHAPPINAASFRLPCRSQALVNWTVDTCSTTKATGREDRRRIYAKRAKACGMKADRTGRIDEQTDDAYIRVGLATRASYYVCSAP
nr:hypothetical protein CFP56_25746 [Quercus suber]